MARLMTYADVSERTGVPVETLRWYRKRRMGPDGFRLGARIVFRPEAVEAWLEEQEERDRRRRGGSAA